VRSSAPAITGPQVDAAALRGFLARHGEERLHDARAALGGGVHPLGAGPRGRVRGRVAQQLGVAGDHREGVVELVGHAGEQRAERGELLALVERLALARDLGLGDLQRGEVEQAGHRAGSPLVLDDAGGHDRREWRAVGPAHLDLDVVDPALGRGEDRPALRRVGEQTVAVERLELLEGEPEGGEEGLVREHQPPVGEPGDAHRRRVALGDGAEALLARLQLGQRPLLGRDVDVEAADLDHPPRRVPHRKPDHQGPGVGVVRLEMLLVAGRLAPLHHLLVEAADHGGLVRREYLGRIPAEHLGRRPAEHLRHLRVEHQVAAGEILQVHADRGVLHERGQPGLAILERRLGPLALRDVERDAAHHRDPPVPVADREADGVGPVVAADVRVVLLVGEDAPGLDDLAVDAVGLRRRLGREQVEGRLADRLRRVAAEELGALRIREQVAALAVFQVDDERGVLHQRRQAGLALPDRRLGLALLGRVAADGLEFDQPAGLVEQRPVGPPLPAPPPVGRTVSIS
jgi:hypothetical protein